MQQIKYLSTHQFKDGLSPLDWNKRHTEMSTTPERMTNQSLGELFQMQESKSARVSQVIALAIEPGAIKPDEKVGASRKFARYLPFWA
jgi:hypothetical protein